MIGQLLICPPDQKEAKTALAKDRTKNRYLPAFEKVSVGSLKSGDTEFQGQEKGRGWETKATATLAFTSMSLLCSSCPPGHCVKMAWKEQWMLMPV